MRPLGGVPELTCMEHLVQARPGVSIYMPGTVPRGYGVNQPVRALMELT